MPVAVAADAAAAAARDVPAVAFDLGVLAEDVVDAAARAHPLFRLPLLILEPML